MRAPLLLWIPGLLLWTPAVATTPSVRTNTVAAWVTRGDALMQQSRDRMNPELYSDARDAYSKALQLDPESTGAMLGLAWVENSEHRFAEGRRWCETVLARDQQSAAAYALLSDSAVEAGEYLQALKWCQRALDLQPDLASYSRAGQLLWLLGQPKRAVELMELAIAAGAPHAENTAWCEAQLQLMLFRTGETTRALARMESALNRFPSDPHVLATATRLVAARGDWERAFALGRRAEAARTPSEGLMLLVDIYHAAGRSDEAARQTERILAEHDEEHQQTRTSHPNSSEFLGDIELARFLADQGLQPDRAVGEARAAWQSAPNQPGAHTLAWCLYRAGQFDQAATWMARALESGIPDPELHFHSGLIHLARKERNAARMAFEKALALNPAFHPRFAHDAKARLISLKKDTADVATINKPVH